VAIRQPPVDRDRSSVDFRSANRFNEPVSRTRIAATVLGAIQVGLYLAAYVDIWRRPAAQIRGSKGKWRVVCLLNTIGPLSYFRWGRADRAAQ
jgi:hypothetical protein